MEIKLSNKRIGERVQTGYISWSRLCDVFRDANELRDGERVINFSVSERGINFTTATPSKED